jgi:hypothetical protein
MLTEERKREILLSVMTKEEFAGLQARKKPKPEKAVVVVVSEKLAAAVKANPDSLRLYLRGDTLVVERPRRIDVVDVEVAVAGTGR